MPIPRGGGARLVDALVRLIEDHGGTCETGRDVERVLVRDGKATGVRLAGRRRGRGGARRDRNVTPTQLYGRLLEPAHRTDARPRASATAAPRCRSTSRSRSRRAGTATSGSARRRSST